MNSQNLGPLPGGQQEEGHGGVHHDHGESYHYYFRTFIKMPAHMEDEFTKMRTITRWTVSRGAWGSPS